MNTKTHSQAESLEDKRRGLQERIGAQFRTVLQQELKAMLEQVLEEELRQQVGAGLLDKPADKEDVSYEIA